MDEASHLCLMRKEGQSIVCHVPGGIRLVVTLTEVSNNRARISFHAPESVKILREEIDPTFTRPTFRGEPAPCLV